MTPTFAQNGEFFCWHQVVRECLLALCMYAVEVQRIRITRQGALIEIDRPLVAAGEVEVNGGYAAMAFMGCSVAWKISEADSDGCDGNM